MFAGPLDLLTERGGADWYSRSRTRAPVSEGPKPPMFAGTLDLLTATAVAHIRFAGLFEDVSPRDPRRLYTQGRLIY